MDKDEFDMRIDKLNDEAIDGLDTAIDGLDTWKMGPGDKIAAKAIIELELGEFKPLRITPEHRRGFRVWCVKYWEALGEAQGVKLDITGGLLEDDEQND